MTETSNAVLSRHEIAPVSQGELDGLCGVYAIINTIRLLCPELDDACIRQLFKQLLAALHKHEADPVAPVWRGLRMRSLKRLARHAARVIKSEHGIRLKARRWPRHTRQHITRLSQLWMHLGSDLKHQRVPIIGFGGKISHWTVVQGLTSKTIRLCDSTAMQSVRRKSCRLAHIRKGIEPNRYLIHPSQILLLERFNASDTARPGAGLEDKTDRKSKRKAKAGHQHARRIKALQAALAEHDIDYGWASDAVIKLCTLNPSAIPFLTTAPEATQHFICLCLLGAQRHKTDHNAFRDLADRIAIQNRRRLLTQLWSVDPGSTRLLLKLNGHRFAKGKYRALMACLADPLRRVCLAELSDIYPMMVERIMEASPDQLVRYRAPVLAEFGGATLSFLEAGFTRLRPDMTPNERLARINAVTSASGMNRLLTNLTQQLIAGQPPWDGTATIKPLRQFAEFKSTGLLMRNCLNSLSIWIEALIGQRAFYLCEGKEPAIAALQHHRLFDLWFLQDIAGRENAPLSPKRADAITAAFASAGFQHPDTITLEAAQIVGM